MWFQQLKARLADEEAQTKVDSGGKRPASSVVVWCAGKIEENLVGKALS